MNVTERALVLSLAISMLPGVSAVRAQDAASSQESTKNSQLKVNWLYGSYVPKDVPLVALNGEMRWKLYIRATYTTWGIYVKTICFATRDQIHDTYPEWGDGFAGYMKRLGSRQGEFIIQNSTIALGDAVLGWEPRYDRCRCSGVWPRTKHALIRNFVTYDRSERSLRPQLMPYLGAFAGSVTSTAWTPGNNRWQVRGYQAAITQVPVGMSINWISEFAPELFGWAKRKK